MIKRYTKSEKESMYSLVHQWEESGMTQKAFAEQNNIKISKLAYWIYRKNDLTNRKLDFIEIPTNTLPSAPQEIILKYPSGVELTLPVEFPVESIKLLLECSH